MTMTDTYLLLNELEAMSHSRDIAIQISYQAYLDRLIALGWIEQENNMCVPTDKFFQTRKMLSLSHMEQIFISQLS